MNNIICLTDKQVDLSGFEINDEVRVKIKGKLVGIVREDMYMPAMDGEKPKNGIEYKIEILDSENEEEEEEPNENNPEWFEDTMKPKKGGK